MKAFLSSGKYSKF